MLEVRRAQTHGDRADAFRLRYEVYIEEYGYPFSNVDHKQRLLTDSWDGTAEIFILRNGANIVGTVRVNDVALLQHDEHLCRYQLGLIAEVATRRICIGSRMILHKRVRGGQGFRLLIINAIQWGLRHFDVCVLDSAPELTRLYMKYGWVPYGKHFYDPALGRRVAMMAEHQHLLHRWGQVPSVNAYL